MFFDTHCHLNDRRYENDIEGYVERAKKAGVNYLLIVAWDVKSSKKAIKIAERFNNVYAAVGIHPVDAVKTPKSDLKELEKLLTHPKVIALGEIGLDYHWIKDEKERAIEHDFFVMQIELANKYRKPVLIHMRDATNDTYEVLKNNTPKYQGIMHSYSGSKEMALRFMDLGMYISLGGPVTFLNAHEPKEVASVVSEERLLLETDAPYLTPHPYRGKLNESANIPLIAEAIATIRNVSVEKVGEFTTKNAKTLFKL
ncbi:MAG: TatD family deoxyribonuclease [Bacillota bacterium]|nr:MAG: TatD family deoxyribonuclease [Bacillota bacterium]